MVRTKKNDGNLLDYVPRRNPLLEWRQTEEGAVQITVCRTGVLNWISQALFKAPKKSTVNLDKYGSFIWLYIDGERTVEQLARQLKEQYGEEAEPLYERLVQYMRILKNNKFIEL
ncbi:MAG: PqqD family protein [Spirochaetia bacterium]